MKLKDLGEFGLIKRLAETISINDAQVVAGIGDDAAVIKVDGPKLTLFTTDSLIEDVHFTRPALSAYQIGWKALAVNLSDIAAMGGVPEHGLVSIGLPSQTSVDFVDSLYQGIKDLSDKFKVNIVGGDTVSSPQLIVNISLLGEVEEEYLALRSGAKAGDKVLVTGDLGGSAAHRLAGKHLSPQPRVEEGRAIVKRLWPTSMIDISDGLASDLGRICESSQVGAKIWLEKIPVSEKTRQMSEQLGEDFVRLALEGGEDYELLFTAQRVPELTSEMDVSLTVIGEITDQKGKLSLIDKERKSHPLKSKGYEHFEENRF
ncbi:thiamine-phosphate kinase [candidate division NPL-UPA2 bacterium]|nr:thiamine-phosphate kinase [candidate division NPL-UPA2 bacterium]